MNYANVLTKDLFEDIIAFSMSELGAMGPNDMMFYKATGESFSVDYRDGKYDELKELFPILKECYWNGPMKNEVAALFTVVIGGAPDDKSTTVPKGMRHIYLDYGNHLTVKEEYYYAIKEAFVGKDNCDIAFNWTTYLDEVNISSRLAEIRDAYFKQKERDEMIMSKIRELNENPEYKEKIKSNSDGMDGLMSVCKEYGLDIGWVELKQIAMRQMGLI